MNMKSLFSLLAFVLFASIAAEGQGWERVYPTLDPLKPLTSSGGVKKVLSVSDGFLYLIWQYLDAPFGFKIVKTRENGVIDWARDYNPTSERIYPQDFITTSDGGYSVLFTKYQAQSQNDSRAWWVKLDAQFDTVFVRELTYPDSVLDVRAKKMLEQNGHIWIFGDKACSTGPDSCFVRWYDLNGNDLGQNTWGKPGAQFSDVLHTGNGDFVAVSNGIPTVGQMQKIFVNQYNQTGSTLAWQKELGDTLSSLGASSLCKSPGDGYLIGGTKAGNPMCMKTSANGDVIWQKVFPDDSLVYPGNININRAIHFVAPTTDGDGYWAVSTNNWYIPRIALLRLDLQGNVKMVRPFGSIFEYSYSYSLTNTTDNQCIIGGSYIGGNPNPVYKPYVLKVDYLGNTFQNGVSGTDVRDADNNCVMTNADTLPHSGIFIWQNGIQMDQADLNQNGDYFIPLDTGTYQITTYLPNPAWIICGSDTLDVVVTQNDTLAGIDFLVQYNPQPIDSIFGYIFQDIDGDCFRDSFETAGYAGWTVNLELNDYSTATHLSFSTVTGPNGYYVFDSLPGATNAMSANVIAGSQLPGNGLQCLFTGCPSEEVFDFSSGNVYQSDIGFQCDSLPPCPIIEVDIATNLIRPCSTSVYHVNYCNNGAQPAFGAYMTIAIDPALTVTGSSIPWTSVNGNAYTFDLGTLATGQCGDFMISALAPCDDPVGTTYCVEAHAYPDTCMAAPGDNWDGSQILVTAECTGDSVVFTIQNIGAGNMQNPLEYIVIEDNVLLKPDSVAFLLAAGAYITLAFPADGSFLRLEAEQSPGFPSLYIPSAWAEGCGGDGDASLGFVNMFPLGDEDPWLDIFCLESANSYDPNDKQGFPRGYDAAHYIDQNTDIEYLIRFQNTGTAPAYQVEIRDTLPFEWLDPTTVRPGASSHDYVWDMQGNGVIVFTFPNIVLPDSNANFDASQGFVKFHISQRKDVPLGTEIENTAAIYFDNNPPVITNRTLHTVGKDFILTKTNTPLLPGLQVSVVPNPARDRVRVQVEGLENGSENLSFVLYSAVGQPILNKPFAGANFEFQASQLPEGVYFYEIRKDGKLAATGKIIKL